MIRPCLFKRFPVVMFSRDSFIARFPALGSRDFLLFWVGQFISLIGTWMQGTTLPYLAYRLTGSSFDLGLIGMAGTIPTLFLALPAGVLVERLDKRKTVIILQVVMMLQAFALAALTLSGHIRLDHILLLSLLMGVANAIEITARQSMLIELVGKERLPNAIALQATIFNAARVIGPSMIAPFLLFIETSGEGWAFFANGVSYIVVIVGLFFAHTPYKSQQPPKQLDFVADFKEGFRYIFASPAIGLLIVMASIIGLVGFPFTQQMPAIAKEMLAQAGDLEKDIAFRNSLLYSSLGIGALAAAILLAVFNPRAKGRLLLAGQAAFILGLIVVSQIRQVNFALPVIVIVGWGMVSQLATMNTLIQLHVPNELRGRVFSVYLWALQGVAPFGSLLVGWMSEHWGVANAALACGLLCLVTIGGIQFFNPVVRRLDH